VYNRSGGGGAWGTDGTVLFQTVGSLQQCPASGGAPARATELDDSLPETSHVWPQFLPGGKRFLYLATSSAPQNSALYVQEAGSRQRVRVMTSTMRAMWAPPGWLLYTRDETLLAQRFDLAALRLSGEPLTVEPSVSTNEFNGRSAFAVSETGVLVSRPATDNRMELVWRDRAGQAVRNAPLTGLFSNLRVSPDERFASLNLSARHPTSTNTWIVDLASGAPVRAAFDPGEDQEGAVWSPDSKEIAYTRRDGSVWRQAPGSPSPVEVQSGIPAQTLRDWSPDGRFLVATNESLAKTFVVPLAGGKAEQVLDLPVRRAQHRISPDGKWIAVAMGGPERYELWLASFPDFGNRRRISVNGGAFPVWRKDARELFFAQPDGTLMSVAIRPEPGTPQPLFQLTGLRRGYVYAWLSGDRFLVLESSRGRLRSANTVTLNWTAGSKP
jgi:dipeptidyl aminopeptidase/acylaminoacyl peptidase